MNEKANTSPENTTPIELVSETESTPISENHFYIITVIPIAKGIFKDSLSYYCSQKVEIGTIVVVPLRGREIKALAVLCESALQNKSALKAENFEMRKIENPKRAFSLPSIFIESSLETADYYATSRNATLTSLLPKQILNSLEINPFEFNTDKNSICKGDISIMQTDFEDRMANYKSIIREEFARKSSLLFIFPTIEDLKKTYDSISKGVSDYTCMFYGQMTKKKFDENWQKCLDKEHPVIILATPSFTCLPRKDIKTVVIERESSRAYSSRQFPYIDYRRFIERYWQKTGARIILGDTLLRIETLYRYKKNEIAELLPPKWRPLFASTSTLIDMRKKKTDTEMAKREEFKVLSPELIELIKYTKEKSSHLFLFSIRRGFAQNTICSDCGSVVSCPECKTPMVIHQEKPEEGINFFLCHRCGEKRKMEDKCANCNSWKLTALGTGTDRVMQEIREIFPDIKLFRIDADSIVNKSKAVETAKKFYNSPGSILIGTEMALYYLHQKIENSAIVSMDSLLSLADFRAREKAMTLALAIRELASEHFLLQTRNPDDAFFEHLSKGNLTDFYREEIEMRKRFNYPPFSTLIKASIAGKQDAVLERLKEFKDNFSDWEPHIFRSPFMYKKTGIIGNALLRLSENSWIDNKLLNKIKDLPPEWLIQIDPENLL